jgi:hypothetical protein
MPLLFSYGTLQQENVQLATFGRKVKAYKRVSALMSSGSEAWVYVDARFASSK